MWQMNGTKVPPEWGVNVSLGESAIVKSFRYLGVLTKVAGALAKAKKATGLKPSDLEVIRNFAITRTVFLTSFLVEGHPSS
jgi:hypothetical protein